MSELSQEIAEMRNMREAYNELAVAAEAYNTGKAQLAANIAAKGVEASATETLPALAEKVASISQETYEIDGGEMYAKQLFGSLETPGYWNLYDVLAQLLSDGRLVNYGGILLAEYYRGYDSLALSGAGAGGAYVVSDKDGEGNFIMYTEDTTHTWAAEFDGYGNRWVAYCFVDEYHDFQITNTSTSPRSIFIGRKIGTITNMVNSRCSEIVVPDGNKLRKFNTGSYTNKYGRTVVFRNLENQNSTIINGSTNIESIFINADAITGGSALIYNNTAFTNVVIDCDTFTGALYHEVNTNNFSEFRTLIIKGNIISTVLGDFGRNYSVFPALTFVGIIGESIYIGYADGMSNSAPVLKEAYVGYISNDKTKSANLYGGLFKNVELLELQNGWCKSISISDLTKLTEANMYAHILQRLKQDEPNCGAGVTITLGSTNLNKLTSEESQELLALLRGTYGYTFA